MQRYDLTADMYEERYAAEQQKKYAAALGKVKAAGGKILDVGCGTGLFFNQTASSAAMVVGVDMSRRPLLKAENVTKTSSNVFVVQADADHLPFDNDSFDNTFAFTVLQNTPKPRETLNEIRRVTSSGGKIVVTGLKKAFPLDKFRHLLEGTTLLDVSFVNDGELNCYIAILAAK